MPRRPGKARHKRPAKDRAYMDSWQLRQAPQQEAGPHQEGVAYVSDRAGTCATSQNFVHAAYLPSLPCK